MNIGATTALPTQPAIWDVGPHNGGGVTLVDPTNQGWAVATRAAYQLGDRLGEIGTDYISAILRAGDVATIGHNSAGVVDATTFFPIVAFDYDTSVFAAGGAIKWGDANGVHKLAIYAGPGAPSNAGGANGDFAFRQDGAAGTSLYMKRAGAWVGIL